MLFNIEKRRMSVPGFERKTDYQKEKSGQLFSISTEEQIVGNGLRLQHKGGYEYKSISNCTLGQTSEEDSSIPITQVC